MKVAKGVRSTPYGYQVYVERDGRYRSKRFPADTDILTLKRERENLLAGLLLHVAPHTGQTFAEDAADYLHTVQAMPTFKDRRYRILRWVEVFGNRPRASITAREIAAVLETWRTTGAADGGKLSPASLNLRRKALMHLYSRLDGKAAPNVVKDVPPFDERDSHQIRAVPMLTLARVIRRVKRWGRARARLHVLMWTGWPSALLKGVKPDDIDWDRARVRLGRRKKGRGMIAAWVPVVPKALSALRRFDARRCYGPFSNSALHSVLARAVASENAARATRTLPPLPHVTVYSLRHAFATWAAGVLKDDRALKELLRTNSIARYTEGALADRLEAARDALAKAR